MESCTIFELPFVPCCYLQATPSGFVNSAWQTGSIRCSPDARGSPYFQGITEICKKKLILEETAFQIPPCRFPNTPASQFGVFEQSQAVSDLNCSPRFSAKGPPQNKFSEAGAPHSFLQSCKDSPKTSGCPFKMFPVSRGSTSPVLLQKGVSSSQEVFQMKGSLH